MGGDDDEVVSGWIDGWMSLIIVRIIIIIITNKYSLNGKGKGGDEKWGTKRTTLQ